MLVKIGKNTEIVTMLNNDLLTLSDSGEWSVWMDEVRDMRKNTIMSFMKGMERFWLWSLYNPIGVEQTFPSYQGQYRKALRNGFKVTYKTHTQEPDDTVEIILHSCKPLAKVTINKEFAGINSYFYFTEESKLIEDHRFINQLYERQRASRSFLSSVEVKSSSVSVALHGKKVKYMPPYKVSRNRQKVKYFPMELFDELLSLAKPRERLIYLLSGACSARIGQVLNMTLYDIDYDKKEVWLLDPKSDYHDIYGNMRKVWLGEEYSIDSEGDNEHNTADLQFKYPIPLCHEELTWLNDKYKDLFFATLREYTESETYVSESIRYPRHPFLFTTKSGRRVHARDTLSRLKILLRKLSLKHEGYEWINDLGLHSLRHFFGHSMAELYAQTGDDALIMITMEAMGHSSVLSTFVYFNISSETKKKILKKHSKQIHTKG